MTLKTVRAWDQSSWAVKTRPHWRQLSRFPVTNCFVAIFGDDNLPRERRHYCRQSLAVWTSHYGIRHNETEQSTTASHTRAKVWVSHKLSVIRGPYWKKMRQSAGRIFISINEKMQKSYFTRKQQVNPQLLGLLEIKTIISIGWSNIKAL